MTYFEVEIMDIEQMMIQYQEKCPRLLELNEDKISRVHKIIGYVEETVFDVNMLSIDHVIW